MKIQTLEVYSIVWILKLENTSGPNSFNPHTKSEDSSHFYNKPFFFLADLMVLCISIVIVIGPTPLGTGVI